MYCNSQSAIHLINNHVYHVKTKHIEVWYHHIRDQIRANPNERVDLGGKSTCIVDPTDFDKLTPIRTINPIRLKTNFTSPTSVTC